MKNVIMVIVAVALAGGGYYLGYEQGLNDHANLEQDIADHGDDARVTAANAMLIGTWSSEDDRNFIREYKDDGSMVDSYASAEGETETDATWELFTADTAGDDVTFQLNNRDVYIAQTERGGEKLYFRIISVTPDTLELMNMESAGAMRFGKMTTGQELQDGQED